MITQCKRALVHASVTIEDGKWTVTDSGDATLYLKEDEVEALDSMQKQAELVVKIGEGTAQIDLSCDDVDALADALETIQEAE